MRTIKNSKEAQKEPKMKKNSSKLDPPEALHYKKNYIFLYMSAEILIFIQQGCTTSRSRTWLKRGPEHGGKVPKTQQEEIGPLAQFLGARSAPFLLRFGYL